MILRCHEVIIPGLFPGLETSIAFCVVGSEFPNQLFVCGHVHYSVRLSGVMFRFYGGALNAVALRQLLDLCRALVEEVVFCHPLLHSFW